MRTLLFRLTIFREINLQHNPQLKTLISRKIRQKTLEFNLLLLVDNTATFVVSCWRRERDIQLFLLISAYV